MAGVLRGRPCDYSGLSYDALRGGSGIQWPVTADVPEGTARLYTDGVFPTHDDVCETYGHDLMTGGTVSSTDHAAARYYGRARLKAAPWFPAPEAVGEDHPLQLSTGRTVHHFHTRTKTGRAPELQEAAPDAWVELAAEDAEKRGITEGDLVRVSSTRGSVEVAARIGRVRPGSVFIPFHYGDGDGHGRRRAANELTLTLWDPVSKQPQFKGGAVQVSRVPSSPEEG